tara:strand:- start:115 stop:423 length:309 start_codon:yes stop_codon:yes gene_type:complete
MSGIIYESETGEGLGRFMIDLGDGRNMTVNVTSEGVIMDVYGKADTGIAGALGRLAAGEELVDVLDGPPEDEHLGTAGMMFDEWADWIVERIDPSLKIGERA